MDNQISKFPVTQSGSYFPPEIMQRYSGSTYLTKPLRHSPSFILRYGPDVVDLIDVHGDLIVASFFTSKECNDDVGLDFTQGV